MRVVIQMSRDEELKALPILLRRFAGTVWKGGVYTLSEEAVSALRDAGWNLLK